MDSTVDGDERVDMASCLIGRDGLAQPVCPVVLPVVELLLLDKVGHVLPRQLLAEGRLLKHIKEGKRLRVRQEPRILGPLPVLQVREVLEKVVVVETARLCKIYARQRGKGQRVSINGTKGKREREGEGRWGEASRSQ